MENKELKDVLNKLTIPEPSEEAKNRAVQSAMAEFRMAAEKNKDRIKGFAWLNRLISKKPKGGFFMNRTITASTAGLAVSLITFAIVFSPTIISHIRRNSAPVTSQEVQIYKKDYSSEPAESATATQKAGEKANQPQTSRQGAQLTQTEQGKALSDQVKTLRPSDADAPLDVSPPEEITGRVFALYSASDDSSDGNIAESIEIGMLNDPQSEIDMGTLKKSLPPETGTTDQNTAPGILQGGATAEKKDFSLEEIIETAEKGEVKQYKSSTTMDAISGEGLSESRKMAVHEAAEARGRAEAEMAAAKAKALPNAATELSGGMRVSLNQPAPANEFTLNEITVTRVNDSGRSMINPEYVGRDRFEDIKTNTVELVSEEPVSTFSIDVDTSSYAFVRRALNSGYLPQADSVRIEEMINYFDYDYPLPRDKSEPFKPTVAIFQTPWNVNTKLLHIGIKGYDIVPEKKPKANLTFLIDVSGSMRSEDKLPLLKNSLRMLVDTLDKDDTVAIAVYAGAAGTVLERTKALEKQKILAAIDKLQAGGSTAGGEGIKLAYSLAEEDMDSKAVNRVILATDGDFNVGITDKDVLQDFIERKRKSGIYLSVLGFGQGNYNDELMQKLAQNGNGNAAYIDNLNEARKVLVDESTGTLFTIAKDVKIQVEFNPDMISEYRLIGYETRQLNREDFKNDNVDAGDIGSGHSVTAIYEVTPKGSDAQLIDDLRYGSKKDPEETKKSGNASEYAFLKIRYKLPDEDTGREISTPIDKGNEYKKVSDAPADSRFASAVAAFGQLLRGDAYINQFTYDDVIALASDAKKDDAFGYRAEFINLVRLAKTASAMGDR